MRNVLCLLLLSLVAFMAPVTAQNIALVEGEKETYQVRVSEPTATGAENITLTRPLSLEEAVADLLYRFRQANEEVAVYETRLVEARKRANELKTLIENVKGRPIQNEFEEALKSLKGSWVLVTEGGKTAVEIDERGSFYSSKESGSQVVMRGPREFLLQDWFTESRLFGLLHPALDVIFYQENERVWRAKSENEIILIRQ